MKAAVVSEFGKPPTYGDFRDPVASEGHIIVEVTASALSQLTRARAAGTHYSSSGDLPFVPGADGVGRLADGRRVYFFLPDAPFGGLGEKTLVQSDRYIPIPDDLDDITAAAIANPGMASWGACVTRAHLQPGETVLINGATGNAGRLTIQIAKYLGAKKVIATGREPNVLQTLGALGADATISLSDSTEAISKALDEQFREGVDVVIDYLFGPSAEAIIRSASTKGKPEMQVRFVQVGAVSNPAITLQGSALRSSGLLLMGSGIGSISTAGLLQSIEGVFQATIPGKFRVATKLAPLGDIENVWTDTDSTTRTVIVIDS